MKLLVILLVSLLAFSLVGCTQPADTNDTTAGTTPGAGTATGSAPVISDDDLDDVSALIAADSELDLDDPEGFEESDFE